MIKQLLNSVIAKYHDLSVSRRSIICLSLRLRQIIHLLATDKSRYFAQPRPIIINYSTSIKIISFNKNIYSTSIKIISFNKNIYSTSTKIISFSKNTYSTSTKNNFIQQESSRTFKISSFNKMPRPSPVKYKTTLSHASNISKTLSNTQL